MTGLLIVLGAFVNAVILGFVTRRLLGAPVGWPRAILVSLLISSGTGSAVAYLGRVTGLDDQGLGTATGIQATQAGLLVILALAWSVAIGLAVLVVLEAIVPTGSLPSPISLVRSLPARRRRSRRYAQIFAITARHGLGGYLRGRRPAAYGRDRRALARSVREALTEGGVTFIKLGQMLATRPDLIGEDFARELSQLQSEVPGRPWSEVVGVVEAELGQPADRVFASVDDRPVAAASVAQVHLATAPRSRSRCSAPTPASR